jgi:hypothetical protein
MNRNSAKDWGNKPSEGNLPAVPIPLTKELPDLPAGEPAAVDSSADNLPVLKTTGATPAIDEFQGKVVGLVQSILFKDVALDDYELPEAGEERERLKNAARRRILQTYDRIMAAKTAEGDTGLLIPIRHRLSRLFGLEEFQFAPTPEEIDQEMLNNGTVYVPGANGSLNPAMLEKIQMMIEARFIAECQDVDQQKQVIILATRISPNALTFVGRRRDYAMFQLREDLLKQLTVASFYSGQMTQIPVQEVSAQPAATPSNYPLTGSAAQPDLNNLNMGTDWDWDVDWTPLEQKK